jgi:hypothetical protein
MATVDSVKLSATTHPGYIHANNVSQESADKVSQLLIENHDKFHVFFDYRELHSKPHFPQQFHDFADILLSRAPKTTASTTS